MWLSLFSFLEFCIVRLYLFRILTETGWRTGERVIWLLLWRKSKYFVIWEKLFVYILFPFPCCCRLQFVFPVFTGPCLCDQYFRINFFVQFCCSGKKMLKILDLSIYKMKSKYSCCLVCKGPTNELENSAIVWRFLVIIPRTKRFLFQQ